MDIERRQINNNTTKICDIIAFWIFGLCNNYGYVVMLTAAEDILKSQSVISWIIKVNKNKKN